MDQSMKLQMDVKNNAEDLRNYALDLNNWIEEMNKKDKALSNERPTHSNIPPPRNKIKRSKPANENSQSDKPKKISAYDYSAWDKFDVEKACAEIDTENSKGNIKEEEINENSGESDEETSTENIEKSNRNLSLIDEAYFEKEMGNSFVKKEQWTDAIKCYTNAINLDKKNAVYYANRSLCFLKIKNFKAAETDATTALQLDNKYIKAYQRRAFSREALGQHVEAKSDYEEILKLEPKNSLARLEINKINDKLNKENALSKPVTKLSFNPKDIFRKEECKPKNAKAAEAGSKKTEVTKSDSASKKSENVNGDNKSKLINPKDSIKNLNGDKKLSNFEKGDGDKITQNKSNELILKNFKPLPEGCRIVYPVNIPPHKRSKKPMRKIEIIQADKTVGDSVEKKESFTNLNEKREVTVFSKLKGCTVSTDNQLTFDIPKSAIQFQKSWIVIRKNLKEAYSYLKKITGSQLAQIFENSLESDFFSELISFLASDDVNKEGDVVYDFLLGFSKVKRFSSLVLFMSNADKSNVKKCISLIEKIKSKEEVSELCRLYEL